MKPQLSRRIVAEFVGTLLLLAAVVGSGIMGERLAGGNIAIALLANTLATGAALDRHHPRFRPDLRSTPQSRRHSRRRVAGRHRLARNSPLHRRSNRRSLRRSRRAAHSCSASRCSHASTHVRSGPAQIFSEFVATFGLLAVIWGCVRRRPSAVPFAVGAYITAAYWFTASTSFANPAVTLARSMTDTFAGIRPHDVIGFVTAQFAGAFAATSLFGWLIPSLAKAAPSVLISHDQEDETLGES